MITLYTLPSLAYVGFGLFIILGILGAFFQGLGRKDLGDWFLIFAVFDIIGTMLVIAVDWLLKGLGMLLGGQ